MRVNAVAIAAACATIAMWSIAPEVSAETITPYSKYLKTTCNKAFCTLNFPDVAAGTRLEIEHISCQDFMAPPSSQALYFGLTVAHVDTTVADYNMDPVWNNTFGDRTQWVIDKPVFIPILAGQFAHIYANIDASPTSQLLGCTLSGHKVVL